MNKCRPIFLVIPLIKLVLKVEDLKNKELKSKLSGSKMSFNIGRENVFAANDDDDFNLI